MFSSIVDLYRKLGRPEVIDGVFRFEGQVSEDIIAQISAVDALPSHFGNFEVNSITGDRFTGEFCLPSSEVGRFHQSISAFIEDTPSLNFGELPAEFYIQDIDYYSNDPGPAPESIGRLKDICRLINGLSALASSKDMREIARPAENRLLFVLAADGKTPTKTLVLPVKILPADLDHELPHVKLIELLVSDNVKDEIHVEERRSIMRIAIAETLAIPDDRSQIFSYLVKQWRVVLEKYRHNVLAFVNQYAFEKVRKEIATAEIDHATRLSNVLGDIAGKLLALPISLGAVILLRKSTTQEEFWILFVSLVAISTIFVGVLWNQWIQVRRLRASFDFIFGQYNEDAFPKRLRAPIAAARTNIAQQYRVLRLTFGLFGFLATLPALGALFVVLTPLPWTLADFCILLAYPT